MIKRLLFCLITTFSCHLAIAQSISSNSPLCTDNSPTLELKASGGSTYAWSGPNSFTSNQQNPTISKATASNAGTYTCVVDGKTSLTVGVKVGKFNSTFFISWGTNNAQLNINVFGNSINLSSVNTLKYSWTGPNNFNSTLRENLINGFDKNNSGVYKLTVTDEFGCVSSISTLISVADCSYSPNISVVTSRNSSSSWSGSGQLYSLSICEGTEAVFRVDTTYWGKNVKIQWFKNDKVIDNAVGLQYKSTESATYHAQILKGSCSYITSKLKLQAQNIKPVMTLYQSNGVVATERIICDKGGYTDLNWTYPTTFITESITSSQWYRDGVAVLNVNPTTVSTFKATEAGSYQVKVTNGKCEAISDPFEVKVSNKIKTSFGLNTAGYYSTENQKVFKFCSENDNYVIIEAYGDGDKKIYKNKNIVFKESWVYSYYNASQQPGTYVLETKQGQCTSLDTLILEYGKSTQVPLIKYTDVSCFNPSKTNYFLYSINPYSGIKWYKDGSLFSSGNALTVSASGQYQGIFENTTTGCKGETEKINFMMPSVPNRQIFQITYLQGKKVVICKNSKESRRLTISSSYSQGVLKRNGVIHDVGNSSSITFISQAGKYWYEYNSGQCVFYSDTLEAVEEELPKVTLTQSCLKDNTIKLTANSTSNIKYNWFQNGVVLNSKDTTITTSQTGKYVVETYRNGCFVTSNEINIGVSIPEITNICNGDSLKLKAISDASNTYSWTGPNNFKSSLQNPVVAKTNKTNQGTYKLSATDKSGCTFTAQTQVTINEAPAFTLPKTITACAGSDFQFNQLVSKPLTDSTETVSNYYAVAPNKNTYYNNFFLSNVSAKDAGIYNFTVIASQGGCTVKTTTELIIDASNACKSISMGNLDKRSICAEQTLEIPFKTTGNFKAGTVFWAYAEERYYSHEERQEKIRKVILGTATKSPVKVSGFMGGRGYDIKVESEEGLTAVGSRYVYATYINYNYIADTINGQSRNSECTSFPLKLAYNNTYKNQQWFFNGDTLKKETGRTLTATKSGKYTFIGMEASGCLASFSKDVIIGKLDKPQIVSGKLNELSCFNESVSLNVTQYPNTNYVWKRDGILQTGTDSNINATTPGKYTVEISKESCKVSSDTIIVKQNTEKIIALNAYTYKGNDKDKMLQSYLTTDYLGNGIYNYQVFKDNQIVAEGRESTILIKDAGKYFFKISKGDCEAVSNIVDYTLVGDLEKRNLYFNGGYEYNTNTIQLCDSNTVQYIYGYPSYEYQQSTIASRKIIAYRDNKPLPAYKEQGSPVYPSLRKFDNNSTFYLYFKGAGTYYVLEELTLKDSTKLKFRYGDVTVQISSQVNLGSKTPENLFFCGDSTIIYGNTYVSGQRPIAFNWKKDGIIVKKINANESSSLSVKQAGTYVLETVYKGGCMAIATPLKVELQRMNVILTDVPSLEFCEGKPISLNSYIYGLSVSDSAKTDTTKITYQLLKDGKEFNKGSAVSGQRGSAYLTLLLKDGGVYKVNAQQGKCQGSSNDLELKAIKVPNSINYADSVLFCQTQSVNLKTTEDATLSYLWERDGGFIKDASKATLEVKETGIYRSLNRKASCWNYTPKVRSKVLDNVLPTAIITGDKDINYADTAKVSIAFTSHAPWTFKLSDGKEYTTTKSPFEVSLRPQFSTNYTLTEVKNVCGIGTISGTANIKVLVLSSELEEGINLNVFPVPTTEDVTIQVVTDKPEVMEWTLNNTFGNVLMSEVQGSRSIKHESKISLKTVPVGTYFLRIQVGEKSLIRKIIKSN